MIFRDLEVVTDTNKYRLSNNPLTFDRIKVISFNVSDIEREHEYETIDRLKGRFNTGTKEEYRTATLIIEYNVKKMSHAVHLRNQLTDLFNKKFYARDLVPSNIEVPFLLFDDPDYKVDLNYATGMQIELKLKSIGDFDTSRLRGEIELKFETTEIPLYVSIGRSLDLEKTTNRELWSSDMKIPFYINEQRKYTFENVKNGTIYYHGTASLNQFNMDSIVEIVIGSDTKEFSWTMQNSEIMKIEGVQLNEGDVVKYDGLQTFKNNIPINEFTSLAQPVYEPGANTFEINQNVKSIKFNTRFYYL